LRLAGSPRTSSIRLLKKAASDFSVGHPHM
jgi:hypothetical protein